MAIRRFSVICVPSFDPFQEFHIEPRILLNFLTYRHLLGWLFR